MCFDHSISGGYRLYYKQNDILTPAAPTNLTIASMEPVQGGLTLNFEWDANSENDLARYDLWRTSEPTDPNSAVKVNASPIDPSQSPSYSWTMPNGRNYVFYVTAVDLADNESEASNTVQLLGPPAAPTATAPSSGRKLARLPGETDCYRIFVANDSIFVNLEGEDWGEPEVLAPGDEPTIAVTNGPSVFAVYRQGYDIKYSLKDDGTWYTGTLFTGSQSARPGPPSVVAPPASATTPPYAYAAFPVYYPGGAGSAVMYAKFSQTALHLQTVRASSGAPRDSFVSIACTATDKIHIAWQHGDTTWSSVATSLPSNWGNVAFIPLPSVGTVPAKHPFIEAFGDVVYLVWQDRSTETIKRSTRSVWNPSQAWTTPAVISRNGYAADFPVQSRSIAAAWQEEVQSGSYDIMTNVDGLFYNLSATVDSSSESPHIDAVMRDSSGQLVVSSVYGMWTEEIVPDSVYEVGLVRKDLGGDSPGRLAASHTVVCGDEEPSLYCRRRTGHRSLRGIGFDVASDSLRYSVTAFDPRYGYRAELVFLHDDKDEFSAAVRCGDVELTRVEFGSERAETVTVDIPYELYAGDSVLALRVCRLTGDYVALAGVKLYAYEDFSRERGGQYALPITARTESKLLSCGPNPTTGEVHISYELAQRAQVRLAVYDAGGRRVKTLADGCLPTGSYAATWNGRDALNRMMPNGIYFCRADIGGVIDSRKVVLQR